MTGFFGKLFGKKDEEKGAAAPIDLIHDALSGVAELAGLRFEFDIEADPKDKEKVMVEIYGEDDELLRAKDGQLLDALQLFLTRAVQNQLRDERVIISVDSAGYREQANQELTELAEKLKNIALEKGKPVYFRAMPPRERKIIHQYLADDARVKSRSIGDGLYKKIKIYPLKGEDSQDVVTEQV